MLIKLSNSRLKKSKVYLKRKPQSKSLSFDGLWLLVVDDNDDSLNLVLFTFQEYQVYVKTASSVDEAVEVMEKWQPDVLISDISMPSKNGYSLISYIRSKEAKKGGYLPAIALTGYLYPEYCNKALEAGFDKVICKPFDPDELIASVAKLAQRSNKQRLVKKLQWHFTKQRLLSQRKDWQFNEYVQQPTEKIQLTWEKTQHITEKIRLTWEKTQQLTKKARQTRKRTQQLTHEIQMTWEKTQQLTEKAQQLTEEVQLTKEKLQQVREKPSITSNLYN